MHTFRHDNRSVAKGGFHAKSRLACSAAVLLALSVCALLVGCTQAIDSPNTSNRAEQHVSPYGLSGTVTMAEYMSERYASFDDFAQSMEGDTSLVKNLRLYVEGETDGYVCDTDTMRKAWNDLCAIRIDLDHPSDDAEGAYLSFDFDSGSELISFSFRTTAYAEFSEDDRFPIENPDAVQAILDELAGTVEQGNQSGEEVPYEDGAYLWDADGDGVREHVWADFIDNGDEAPSVLTIRVFGDTLDASGTIERAYGVERMESGSDERGPFLTVTYLEGDFYAHDHEAACTLRIEEGKLVVE